MHFTNFNEEHGFWHAHETVGHGLSMIRDTVYVDFTCIYDIKSNHKSQVLHHILLGTLHISGARSQVHGRKR